MPKKQVNESIKNKVLMALFKALATGDERKALKTALGKNPAMGKHIKKLASLRKDIDKELQKMGPKAVARAKELQGL